MLLTDSVLYIYMCVQKQEASCKQSRVCKSSPKARQESHCFSIHKDKMFNNVVVVRATVRTTKTANGVLYNNNIIIIRQINF